MKYNKFTGITSTIVIVLMLTTTVAMGQLNMLQISSANAQNQAGLQNPQFAQGPTSMQMNNGTNHNPSSTMTQVSNLTGSISIFSPIISGFKSSIHVSLTDAIKTAENSIGNNSTTVAAFIHPDKGFIVYNIFALDYNSNAHRVIVDPGNGKILSSQQMSIIEMMKILHGGGGSKGMGSGMDNGMMMNHGMGMDNALH